MNNCLIALAFLALAACTSTETSRRAAPEIELPPMKTFSTVTTTRPQLSNAVIARDFLDLVFRLENGDRVPVFSRFDGPITVEIKGTAPPTLIPDLDRLLKRLQREAKIPITRTEQTGQGAIVIEPVPRAQIQRVASSAACFVRPNVASWEEYRARRSDKATYWNRLSERRRMAIFLPRDVSPQEIRDCLHEELAQALGPVNDLYRLSQSIFNDDNFHTVLTGFDMLILRTYYEGTLRTGMSEFEVRERLPRILARLNPAGGRQGIAPPRPEPGAWTRAINDATSLRASKPRRLAAAKRAVALAGQYADTDPRAALSYYVLGRVSLATDPDQALNAFLTAGRIYQSRPDARIQEGHVALQMAAFQLSAGHADVAIALVDANLGVVRQAEHAALLSLLLMVKAEALELRDRPGQAARVQRDALAWARYGFGDKAEIRDRAAEVLAISPRSRSGGPA